MVENLIFGIYALIVAVTIALISALWKISDRITDKIEAAISKLSERTDQTNEKIGAVIASLEGLRELIRLRGLSKKSNPIDPLFTLKESKISGRLVVDFAESEKDKTRLNFYLKQKIPRDVVYETISEIKEPPRIRVSGMAGDILALSVDSSDAKEIANIVMEFLHKLDEKLAKRISELKSLEKAIDEEITKRLVQVTDEGRGREEVKVEKLVQVTDEGKGRDEGKVEKYKQV